VPLDPAKDDFGTWVGWFAAFRPPQELEALVPRLSGFGCMITYWFDYWLRCTGMGPWPRENREVLERCAEVVTGWDRRMPSSTPYPWIESALFNGASVYELSWLARRGTIHGVVVRRPALAAALAYSDAIHDDVMIWAVRNLPVWEDQLFNTLLGLGKVKTIVLIRNALRNWDHMIRAWISSEGALLAALRAWRNTGELRALSWLRRNDVRISRYWVETTLRNNITALDVDKLGAVFEFD